MLLIEVFERKVGRKAENGAAACLKTASSMTGDCFPPLHGSRFLHLKNKMI